MRRRPDCKTILLFAAFPRKCLSEAGVGANHFRQHPSQICKKIIYMEPKADCVWQDIGENGQRERSGASFSVTSTEFLRCSLSRVSGQSPDRGYKGDPLDECIKSAEKLKCRAIILPLAYDISCSCRENFFTQRNFCANKYPPAKRVVFHMRA